MIWKKSVNICNNWELLRAENFLWTNVCVEIMGGLLMRFVRVGQHYINLNNINYTVRDGNKVIVFFRGGTEHLGKRSSYLLNLVDADADEFERQISCLLFNSNEKSTNTKI